MDEALQERVESERTRVLGLESRLSRRRAAEAAELEVLAVQQADVHKRTGAGTSGLAQSRVSLAALVVREQALEQGLSRAHRSWLRVGEPVLAGLLLFFALVLIGVAFRHHAQTAGLEVLALFVGLLLGLARRSRLGAR